MLIINSLFGSAYIFSIFHVKSNENVKITSKSCLFDLD